MWHGLNGFLAMNAFLVCEIVFMYCSDQWLALEHWSTNIFELVYRRGFSLALTGYVVFWSCRLDAGHVLGGLLLDSCHVGPFGTW